MIQIQESSPKLKSEALKFNQLITKLNVPTYIVDESFKLYKQLLQMGYNSHFILFLSCFSIKQKLHMDKTIKLSSLSKLFNVNLKQLYTVEKSILIRLKYNIQ